MPFLTPASSSPSPFEATGLRLERGSGSVLAGVLSLSSISSPFEDEPRDKAVTGLQLEGGLGSVLVCDLLSSLVLRFIGARS